MFSLVPLLAPHVFEHCSFSDGVGGSQLVTQIKAAQTSALIARTSQQQTSWVTDDAGFMEMACPSGQTWGSVFISYGGNPINPPRPCLDVSSFSTLSVDLRGALGGEVVSIGIKDNTDPDDGTETKVAVNVTTDWVTHTFLLSEFTTADPKRLCIAIEFVFGTTAETVDFRNIKLTR